MALMPASPLIARMLRNFLFGGAVIFVLVTIATLVFEYNARISRLQVLLEDTIEFVRAPVTRSLWNYDIAQLQTEMQSLVLSEVLYKVEVYDERGQLLAMANKPGVAASIDDVITRELHAADSSKVIGSLRLHISLAPLREQFWHNVRYVLLAEFVIIAVLAALLFYLLHRTIIAPLLALAQAVDRLDARDTAQHLRLPRASHRPDEIDGLIDAINRFHGEIAAERDARQQVELQSRSLSNELARMGRVATVQSLTTTIAHELNQPLGAILGNAETIELSMLQAQSAVGLSRESLREVLADIVSEARRAGAIVRNMRNLTEKRDVETTALALNPLVQQVVELVRFDARWDAIRIALQLGEDLPLVRGNAVQLQQVILNLAANARDAIRNAGGDATGLITIATRQLDGRWIQVSVTDNGPGISPEKFDYILKPFFTTKEGGTGMGLWIAQMIVEQHGGKLEFGNVQAGGAQFHFTLPMSPS